MSLPPPTDAERAAKERSPSSRAAHGYRNEVSWDTDSGQGEGAQPYANQGPHEAGAPAAAGEVEAGNRGPQSGENLRQLDEVKRKP